MSHFGCLRLCNLLAVGLLVYAPEFFETFV
jgi:hypothetical protein